MKNVSFPVGLPGIRLGRRFAFARKDRPIAFAYFTNLRLCVTACLPRRNADWYATILIIAWQLHGQLQWRLLQWSQRLVPTVLA